MNTGQRLVVALGAAVVLGVGGGGRCEAGVVPFSGPAVLATNAGLSAVALADVDQDGDLDLFAASSAGVAWHPNLDGLGTMGGAVAVSGYNDVRRMGVGDFDRNGQPDLALVSSLDGVMAMLTNAGGSFAPRFEAFGPQPISIVVGDVDQDGTDDVVFGRENGSIEYVQNAGLLVTTAVGSQSGGALSVDIGHFLRLSRFDVVAADVLGPTVFYWDFSNWIPSNLVTGVTRGVRVLDWDGDGDSDVAASSAFTNGVSVLNNLGDGTFQELFVTLSHVGPDQMLPADVNGDGFTDLLITFKEAELIAWVELGPSGFVAEHVIVGALPDLADVTAGDIDRDGDLDIVCAVKGSGEAVLLRQENIHREFAFAPEAPINVAADGPRRFAAGDLDLDGDADLVVPSFNDNAVTIAWNADRAGTFTNQVLTTNLSGAYLVGLGDINLDAFPDIAALGFNLTANQVTLFRRDTGYLEETTGLGNFGGRGLALARLEAAGPLDLIYARTTGIEYHPNSGGTFSATVGLANLAVEDMTACDWNRDGTVDFAVLAGNALTLVPNQGTPPFGAVPRGSPFAPTLCLNVADMDKDGIQDFLLGGASAVWLKNDGAGQLVNTQRLASGSSQIRWMEPADLDGDGDIDLVLADSTAEMTVLGNEGSGFAFTTNRFMNEARDFVRAVDVDRDGRMDLVTSRIADDQVGWWRNVGGQFRMIDADRAPSNAVAGETIVLMETRVEHAGRPGDQALELAALQVSFRDAANAPLDEGALTNAVRAVSLVRDADENQIFEPGIDPVLVTQTPRLTNGVVTLEPVDGDFQAEVSFGQLGRFFLVAELSPIAPANFQFSVLHLKRGPDASRAEDAVFDIPLEMTELLDFPTRLVTVRGAALSVVQFTNASLFAVEQDGPVPVAVERSGDTNGTVQATISVSAGTAVAGTDFAPTNATVTWQPGELGIRSFDVVLFDDSTNDGPKTVVLALGPVTGAVPGSPSNAVLQIADNDAAGSTGGATTGGATTSGATTGGSTGGTGDTGGSSGGTTGGLSTNLVFGDLTGDGEGDFLTQIGDDLALFDPTQAEALRGLAEVEPVATVTLPFGRVRAANRVFVGASNAPLSNIVFYATQTRGKSVVAVRIQADGSNGLSQIDGPSAVRRGAIAGSGDLNQDGVIDLVVQRGRRLVAHLSEGDGSWGEPTLIDDYNRSEFGKIVALIVAPGTVVGVGTKGAAEFFAVTNRLSGGVVGVRPAGVNVPRCPKKTRAVTTSNGALVCVKKRKKRVAVGESEFDSSGGIGLPVGPR